MTEQELEQVERLFARVRELEAAPPKAGTEVIIEIHRRIDALEAKLRAVHESVTDRLRRLETAESEAIRHGSMVLAQQFQDRQEQGERERRARWHATYNAALGRVASFTHGAAASEREMQAVHDTVDRACVMYADRAHGPLEGSVPLKTLAVCSEVDALVKAARDALNNGSSPLDVWQALDAALKPFEPERGE